MLGGWKNLVAALGRFAAFEKDNLFWYIVLGAVGWTFSNIFLQYSDIKNERIKQQISFYFDLLSAASNYTASAYPIIEKPEDLIKVLRAKGAIEPYVKQYEFLYWAKNAYVLEPQFEGCFSKLRDRIDNTYIHMDFDIANQARQASPTDLKLLMDSYLADVNSLHKILRDAGRALEDYHVAAQRLWFLSFLFSPERERLCQ